MSFASSQNKYFHSNREYEYKKKHKIRRLLLDKFWVVMAQLTLYVSVAIVLMTSPKTIQNITNKSGSSKEIAYGQVCQRNDMIYGWVLILWCNNVILIYVNIVPQVASNQE